MTDLKEAAFPKSGHVNEVCKEWLVREDGALAYRLQSQEINEFYRGNKFRNAVVRQDFPTALNEQIKEKENAEKQAALYHQMINEQEHADAQVAKKLSEKLENDLEKERANQVHASEMMARQLQDIYVENRPQVKNEFPLPPRQANTKYRAFDPLSPQTQTHPQPQMKLLSPNITHDGTFISINKRSSSSSNNIAIQNSPSPSLTQSCHYPSGGRQYYADLAQPQSPPLNSPISKYAFPLQSRSPINFISHGSHPFGDVADSIRQYDLSPTPSSDRANCNDLNRDTCQQQKISSFDEDLMRNNSNFQKLSPEKYDYLMGNVGLSLSEDCKPQHAMPQKYNRRLMVDIGGTANDNPLNIGVKLPHSPITAVEDPERVLRLQQLGLPTDEIEEIDKKIKQELRDEELARQLQEQEAKDQLTQEEKDRLLAIEAQDKELARMLQEREKAKAKRAKERARLKKQQMLQQQHSQRSPGDIESDLNHIEVATSHEKFLDYDKDSYSNPIDLITPQTASPERNLQTANDKIQTFSEYTREHDHRRKSSRDDEIYTLPVDNEYRKRPNTLELQMGRRSAAYLENTDNIAAMIDPTYSSSNPGSSPLSPKNVLTTPEINTSPVPPYMPIQGTRRNTSLENKKKKSKDKCTHQ